MNSNEVYVFISKMNEEDATNLFQEYGSFFEDERVKRIFRCKKNPTEKARLINTGILIHKVFTQYGIDQHKIEYRQNGKPYLKDSTDFFFNISHSGDLIAVAVSGSELGIDLQKVVPYKESLVGKITGKTERQFIESDITWHLNYVWAIKEAYTKLTGKGISTDLSTISYYEGDEGLIRVFDEGNESAIARKFYSDDVYEGVIAMKEDFVLKDVKYFY